MMMVVMVINDNIFMMMVMHKSGSGATCIEDYNEDVDNSNSDNPPLII